MMWQVNSLQKKWWEILKSILRTITVILRLEQPTVSSNESNEMKNIKIHCPAPAQQEERQVSAYLIQES